MHKYRAAAKQAAWYNDEAEDDENYNPFRKIRYRPSQPVVTLPSATQSDEEIQKGKEAVLPDAGATQAALRPFRRSRRAVQSPDQFPFLMEIPMLEVPSRPRRFMVIEYAKQEDDIRGTTCQ